MTVLRSRSLPPIRRRLLPALLLAVAVAAPPLVAHDLSWTPTTLTLDPEGERWTLVVTADLDALALGAPPDADDAELRGHLTALAPEERDTLRTRLADLLVRRVRVRFDGEPVFPESTTLPREGLGEDSWFGLEARMEGAVPTGATTVTVRLSRSFPPAIVRVERPGEPPWHRLLEQGTATPEVPLREPVVVQPAAEVVGDYVALGFLHILPRGADHVLFVLCLFLLSPRWRPLLWQVSAFTLAHTLTLALATLGVVRLAPSVVEPLIALSIAVLALENVFARERLHPWRPAVVFAFGLLHGLGFAGVLGDVGLPESALLPALLGFNVGVELGQIAVLALAFGAAGWARDRPSWRTRVAVPASVAIAALGLFWTIERVLPGL